MSSFSKVDLAILNIHRQLYGNPNKEQFNRDFEEVIKNRNELKPWQNRILYASLPTGLNLLMLACKYGNVDAVEFLIKCGLNLNDFHQVETVNQKGDIVINLRTASDFAKESGSVECIIRILNADGPFPKNFDVYSPFPELGINKVLIKIRRFHDNIANGNLSEVGTFVKKNEKIRYAYDSKNRSALRVALESNQITIHDFLRARFFEAGVDSEKHIAKLCELHVDNQVKIREHLEANLGKTVEDHVITLLSKT